MSKAIGNVFVLVILSPFVLADKLYLLYWHTIGAIWITFSLRWEFRNFGDSKTGFQLLKWLVAGNGRGAK